MTVQDDRYNSLFKNIAQYKRAVIAFSGGTDSTLLLKMAVDALGPDNVMAVTMASPFIPRQEIEEAERIAAGFGASLKIIEWQPLDDDRIRSNPPDRCYYCKKQLLDKLVMIANEEGCSAVLEGSNVSDLSDYRPGFAALKDEVKARSPYWDCGFTKNDIRQLSKSLGLANWNQPSQACLASRIPYGDSITAEKLASIAEAEAFIRGAGFTQVRVRLYMDTARIEVPLDEFPRFLEPELRSALSAKIKQCGFKYVVLDLDGYRTGSLNETIEL